MEFKTDLAAQILYNKYLYSDWFRLPLFYKREPNFVYFLDFRVGEIQHTLSGNRSCDFITYTNVNIWYIYGNYAVNLNSRLS